MKNLLWLMLVAVGILSGANFQKWQVAGTLSYGSSRVPGLADIQADGIEVRNPQDSRSFFELGGSLSAVFDCCKSRWTFGPVLGYEPVVGVNLDKLYFARRPTAIYFEEGKLTQTRLTKVTPYFGWFARHGSIEGQYTIQFYRLNARQLEQSRWVEWQKKSGGITHRFSGWYYPFEHDLGFGLYVEAAPNAVRSVGASVKGNFNLKRR